jgi:hypothetical protein
MGIQRWGTGRILRWGFSDEAWGFYDGDSAMGHGDSAIGILRWDAALLWCSFQGSRIYFVIRCGVNRAVNASTSSRLVQTPSRLGQTPTPDTG